MTHVSHSDIDPLLDFSGFSACKDLPQWHIAAASVGWRISKESSETLAQQAPLAEFTANLLAQQESKTSRADPCAR